MYTTNKQYIFINTLMHMDTHILILKSTNQQQQWHTQVECWV